MALMDYALHREVRVRNLSCLIHAQRIRSLKAPPPNALVVVGTFVLPHRPVSASSTLHFHPQGFHCIAEMLDNRIEVQRPP